MSESHFGAPIQILRERVDTILRESGVDIKTAERIAAEFDTCEIGSGLALKMIADTVTLLGLRLACALAALQTTIKILGDADPDTARLLRHLQRCQLELSAFSGGDPSHVMAAEAVERGMPPGFQSIRVPARGPRSEDCDA